MATDPAFTPGLIHVTEQHTQSVRSAGADIRVSFARKALRKGDASPMSGPVRDFRARIASIGVADDEFAVDRVGTESLGWAVVATAFVAAVIVFLAVHDLLPPALVFGIPFVLHLVGLVDWPYRATCAVRVRTKDAAQARAALDLITSFPRAELVGVAWRYDLVQPSPDWVDACIERANERARRIARTLGVEVLGVDHYAERWRLPDRKVEPITGQACEEAGMRRASKARGMDALPSEPEFVSEGSAEVVVTVAYRVGGFIAPRPTE